MVLYIKYLLRKIHSVYYFCKSYLYSLNFGICGKGCIFLFPQVVYGKDKIFLGNNVVINAFCHIWGQGELHIGNNVMIASHASIITVTHDSNADDMRFSPVIYGKIVIEDDVWIGSGATILPGIVIGRGAVIGAGSVVTRSVQPYAVVVGNPGRTIRIRR
jgi:acetyltransferase-like isoleucine patch superfamily enzyme